MSPWTDSHLLPPNAPWEGPDLDAATCSLHDASLTQLPHRVRTQPREVCRCSCPTGVLTFSCLCGPEANQVVLWMLTLAIAHPQRAHTDTKKMSSLSVPENRLPNAVLSEKKKEEADTQSVQSTTVYTWLWQQRHGQREGGTAMPQEVGARWCVSHPQERAGAISRGLLHLYPSSTQKPVTPVCQVPLLSLTQKVTAVAQRAKYKPQSCNVTWWRGHSSVDR